MEQSIQQSVNSHNPAAFSIITSLLGQVYPMYSIDYGRFLDNQDNTLKLDTKEILGEENYNTLGQLYYKYRTDSSLTSTENLYTFLRKVHANLQEKPHTPEIKAIISLITEDINTLTPITTYFTKHLSPSNPLPKPSPIYQKNNRFQPEVLGTTRLPLPGRPSDVSFFSDTDKTVSNIIANIDPENLLDVFNFVISDLAINQLNLRQDLKEPYQEQLARSMLNKGYNNGYGFYIKKNQTRMEALKLSANAGDGGAAFQLVQHYLSEAFNLSMRAMRGPNKDLIQNMFNEAITYANKMFTASNRINFFKLDLNYCDGNLALAKAYAGLFTQDIKNTSHRQNAIKHFQKGWNILEATRRIYQNDNEIIETTRTMQKQFFTDLEKANVNHGLVAELKKIMEKPLPQTWGEWLRNQQGTIIGGVIGGAIVAATAYYPKPVIGAIKAATTAPVTYLYNLLTGNQATHNKNQDPQQKLENASRILNSMIDALPKLDPQNQSKTSFTLTKSQLSEHPAIKEIKSIANLQQQSKSLFQYMPESFTIKKETYNMFKEKACQNLTNDMPNPTKADVQTTTAKQQYFASITHTYKTFFSFIQNICENSTQYQNFKKEKQQLEDSLSALQIALRDDSQTEKIKALSTQSNTTVMQTVKTIRELITEGNGLLSKERYTEQKNKKSPTKERENLSNLLINAKVTIGLPLTPEEQTTFNQNQNAKTSIVTKQITNIITPLTDAIISASQIIGTLTDRNTALQRIGSLLENGNLTGATTSLVTYRGAYTDTFGSKYTFIRDNTNELDELSKKLQTTVEKASHNLPSNQSLYSGKSATPNHNNDSKAVDEQKKQEELEKKIEKDLDNALQKLRDAAKMYEEKQKKQATAGAGKRSRSPSPESRKDPNNNNNTGRLPATPDELKKSEDLKKAQSALESLATVFNDTKASDLIKNYAVMREVGQFAQAMLLCSEGLNQNFKELPKYLSTLSLSQVRNKIFHQWAALCNDDIIKMGKAFHAAYHEPVSALLTSGTLPAKYENQTPNAFGTAELFTQLHKVTESKRTMFNPNLGMEEGNQPTDTAGMAKPAYYIHNIHQHLKTLKDISNTTDKGETFYKAVDMLQTLIGENVARYRDLLGLTKLQVGAALTKEQKENQAQFNNMPNAIRNLIKDRNTTAHCFKEPDKKQLDTLLSSANNLLNKVTNNFKDILEQDKKPHTKTPGNNRGRPLEQQPLGKGDEKQEQRSPSPTRGRSLERKQHNGKQERSPSR